jgi:hypothetical protein
MDELSHLIKVLEVHTDELKELTKEMAKTNLSHALMLQECDNRRIKFENLENRIVACEKPISHLNSWKIVTVAIMAFIVLAGSTIFTIDKLIGRYIVTGIERGVIVEER